MSTPILITIHIDPADPARTIVMANPPQIDPAHVLIVAQVLGSLQQQLISSALQAPPVLPAPSEATPAAVA